MTVRNIYDKQDGKDLTLVESESLPVCRDD